MAKTDRGRLMIRNLEDGPRSYPLAGGGSVYLPSRALDASCAHKWTLIDAAEMGPELKEAAARGAVAVKDAPRRGKGARDDEEADG